MKRDTAFHIWYIIASVLAVLAVQFFWTEAETVGSVPRSTFLNDLRQGKIAELPVSDHMPMPASNHRW